MDRQRRFLDSLKFRNEEIRTADDHTADVVRSHLAQVRAAFAFADGRPDDALEHIGLARRSGRGIKETLNNPGALLAENGRGEEALELFEEAMAVRGDYRLGRRNHVLTLRRLGRPREALEEAARGLFADPGDGLLFDEGARAALEIPDGPALHLLCDRREALDPADPRPHRYRGLFALRRDGALLAAKSHFERALLLDPGDRESKAALEELDRRSGLSLAAAAGREPEVSPFAGLDALLASDYLFDSGRANPAGRAAGRAQPSGDPPFFVPGAQDLRRGREALRGPVLHPSRPDPLLPVSVPGMNRNP